MAKIFMREADTAEHAHRIAQEMEYAGASVFSIVYVTHPPLFGNTIPKTNFVIWAKTEGNYSAKADEIESALALHAEG